MSNTSNLHGLLTAFVIKADSKQRLERTIYLKLENRALWFCFMTRSIGRRLGGREWVLIELSKAYLILQQANKY